MGVLLAVAGWILLGVIIGKELMRRSVQFQLERNGDGCVLLADVENALDEMLFSGGSLNLKLLGAEGTEPAERPPS